VLASKSLEGNPYDGHTLNTTIDQVVALSGVEPDRIYVDLGYRGHDYKSLSPQWYNNLLCQWRRDLTSGARMTATSSGPRTTVLRSRTAPPLSPR
jgi:hypothetical protein